MGPTKDESDSLLPKIYQDLAHPAASELGDAVGRAMRLALTPVHGVLWTFEQALAWVTDAVTRKLSGAGIRPTDIRPPQTALLGAVLIGLQTAAGDPDLTALYANLLAASMDPARAHSAHPAFAEIIRQLQPDEARILDSLYVKDGAAYYPVVLTWTKQPAGTVERPLDILAIVSNCELPDLLPVYLGNLKRLGLIDYHTSRFNKKESDPFSSLLPAIVAGRISPRAEEAVTQVLTELDSRHLHHRAIKLGLVLVRQSAFGELFLSACHEPQIEPDLEEE